MVKRLQGPGQLSLLDFNMALRVTIMTGTSIGQVSRRLSRYFHLKTQCAWNLTKSSITSPIIMN